MGSDVIRHLRARLIKNALAYYWQPSATLKALGMVSEPLGSDRVRAEARAIQLNQQADEIRRHARGVEPGWPAGSVGRLIDDYRASDEYKGLKLRTQRDYDRWLDRLRDGFRYHEGTDDEIEVGGLGKLHARFITTKVLKAWRKTIKVHAGEYEAFHAIGTMRALWAWAQEEEWIEASPARGVKNPRPARRKETWTIEQMASFINTAREHGHPGLAVAVLVADNIAQSPIDVFGLRAGDFDGRRLFLRGRAKTGVGEGWVQLWPQVAAALEGYLAARREALAPAEIHPDGPLLVNDKTGRRWEESRRGKEFRAIRAAAGLPATLQIQDLRRSAATEGGELGATGVQLQGLLRHTSQSESATYVKTSAVHFDAVNEIRKKARTKSGQKLE